jgi:hypothetical protein
MEVLMQVPATNPATAVTLAALVKLVNLLGAELTVGKYREDIDLVERCVRAKLFAHIDGVSASAHAEGVALAHSLVEPVLKDLRERARRLTPEIAASSVQSVRLH